MLLAQNKIDILQGVVKSEYGNLILENKFSLPRLVNVGVQLLLIASGIGSFIFLLAGAAQWIFAGGDKEGLDKAKKKITGALVGLALTLSAFAIATLANLIFGVNILGDIKIPTI